MQGVMGVEGLGFKTEIGGVVIDDPAEYLLPHYQYHVATAIFSERENGEALTLPNGKRVVMPPLMSVERHIELAEDPLTHVMPLWDVVIHSGPNNHLYRDHRIKWDSPLTPASGYIKHVSKVLFRAAEHAMREQIRGEQIKDMLPIDGDKDSAANLLFELAMSSAVQAVTEGVDEAAEVEGVSFTPLVLPVEVRLEEVSEAIEDYLDPALADVEYRMRSLGDIGELFGWQDPPFERFFIQVVGRIQDVLTLDQRS